MATVLNSLPIITSPVGKAKHSCIILLLDSTGLPNASIPCVEWLGLFLHEFHFVHVVVRCRWPWCLDKDTIKN